MYVQLLELSHLKSRGGGVCVALLQGFITDLFCGVDSEVKKLYRLYDVKFRCNFFSLLCVAQQTVTKRVQEVVNLEKIA